MNLRDVHLGTGVDGLSTFDANVNFDGLIQVHQATITNGTFTLGLKASSGASINMGGNRIMNVDDPQDDSDAATKKYVDGLIGSGTAKDTEQDNRMTDIEDHDVMQDDRMTDIENYNGVQDTRIEQVDTDSKARDAALDSRITGVDDDSKARDTVQDGLIAANAGNIAALDGRVGALDERMTAGFARLDGRIDQAFEGAAMAMAMAAPSMPTDKNYAVSINWGGFEGENAFAGTAQARVSDHLMIHGGIGYGAGSHSVGGRAGLTFAW